MKNLELFLLLITFTILFYLTPLKAQWYDVSSNLPTGWYAWSIDTIDSLTAIGPVNPPDPDSIYITTDGGLTWNPQYQPIGFPVDISMVTEQKIWLCSCSYPRIYATSDGGDNWQLQFNDTSLTKCINYIEMFDSLNGVAMGDAPQNDKPALFLRTTDGGNNWISMNQNYLIGLYSGDLWRRVDFTDINTGYFFAHGESPRKLYKTTNGGTDWDVVNETINWCEVLKFYDENFGIVYPSPNGIYKTTDGGASWEDITLPPDHRYWGDDIEFSPSNPSKIWIANNRTIYLSTDYGNTWTEQVYVNAGFRDLVFTDDEYGWLLASGNIYRTTNGGAGGIVSVKDNRSNSPVSEFILDQNYPNPFNSSTIIKYSVPQTSNIIIKVFDILGNEIEILINEEKNAGYYETEFKAGRLSSGIYIYRLQAGSFMDARKMILLK